MKLFPVTKEHIAEGEAESCEACPVALAIHAGGYPFAIVEGGMTFLQNGTDSLEHSDDVRRWINDFDAWSEDGVPVATPGPVTLVMETDRLLTLSEWQEEHRG